MMLFVSYFVMRKPSAAYQGVVAEVRSRYAFVAFVTVAHPYVKSDALAIIISSEIYCPVRQNEIQNLV